MRRVNLVLLLLIGVAATACLTGRSPTRAGSDLETTAEGAVLEPVCPSEPPMEIDDAAAIRKLEKVATDMIDSGAITPAETLREQLDRRRCALRLAKPSRRTLTPEQIYARRKESVLIVAGIYKCDRCGRWHPGVTSGFLITKSGACVTNYHVIDNAKNHTYVAMTCDGRIFAVREVLAASKRDDVAILQLDAPDARFRPAALSTDAPVGSPVTVLSHPNRRLFTLTQGVVSRYHAWGRRGERASKMTVTADFARGSSGGPVFNERGAVVGLVDSTVSAYYTVEDGQQKNLQMVFKQCVPAESVLALIEL